jgi:hypothetical protein
MAIQPCKMFSGGRHAPFSLLDLRPAQFILSGSKFFGGQIRRLKLDSIPVSTAIAGASRSVHDFLTVSVRSLANVNVSVIAFYIQKPTFKRFI